MSFLKKLLGVNNDSPNEQKKIVSLDIEKNSNENDMLSLKATKNELQPNKKETLLLSKIVGLDDDFIEFVYFPDEQTKQLYKDKINSVLEKFGITNETNFHDVFDILVGFNKKELDEPIPFLIESLLIEDFGFKDESKKLSGKIEIKGLDKINGYYNSAKFIEGNIVQKLKFKQTDYTFEENLFNKHIINSENNNYVKINSFYNLGYAYFISNNLSNAQKYFAMIESVNFELQPSTISEFYKKVGELYLKHGDKIEALKWLDNGLNLNPKLGVKKLIDKLKKEN
jgi:tetratricopeptide (TPR) repeat protein